MGYIENLKAQAEQAAKAKAFDDMQMESNIRQREALAAERAGGLAYEQGMADQMRKLAELQQFNGMQAQPDQAQIADEYVAEQQRQKAIQDMINNGTISAFTPGAGQ